MVREPDATMQPTLQDNQLMSKHRVLGFKPQLRLEGRGQDGQNETKQPDHSASLGDFFTSSTRMRFSVHTGAPRIHGELLKLGIDVGQTSVAKYMVKRREPPSQGWKTFLRNHADGIAAMDMFVVPTISFRLLYGLLIMEHGRRHILWFGVTAHPNAEWIANQVTEACGWEQAPRYLIRDRDGAYGEVLIRRLRSIGIRDRPTSPRSPWQNGYAERLIGSIRRECLDHVIVFSERHLRHLLLCYMKYYNGARTHLSLEKDAPVSRAVDRAGHILCRPTLGGLHHQYARI